MRGVVEEFKLCFMKSSIRKVKMAANYAG